MTNETPLPKLRKKAKDLTPQRVEVLGELIEYQQENGYPPTVRELARRLSLRSPATVHSHLESLERQGLVWRTRGHSRGWQPSSGGLGLCRQMKRPAA